MQQLLFEVPIVGLPLYGFGAMLFLAIVSATWWAGKRATLIGLKKEAIQDLAMILVITGLIGARIFYMVQYQNRFTDRSLAGLMSEFVRIDRGGIVFYGSLIGGFVGFMGFRHFVLRRLNISTWQLADVLAPLLALGLAVGRIGCYLNGCCWGQVAVPECQTVPLSGTLGQFPLLPALAKDQLVGPAKREGEARPQCRAVQTATGFITAPANANATAPDPRSVITKVEPGSEAAAAGLQPGDRITAINGKSNEIVLLLDGNRDAVERALVVVGIRGKLAYKKPERSFGPFGCGRESAEAGSWIAEVEFEEPVLASAVRSEVLALGAGAPFVRLTDRYMATAEDWPRAVNSMALTIERNGQRIDHTLTPRTVSLFPTQVYEAVSMLLLIAVLLAYQPFRRHDGQLFVVWMLGYGVHRFLNEALRIEPQYSILGIRTGLTASQYISLGIILAGLVLELLLRRYQPRLGPPPKPLGASPA